MSFTHVGEIIAEDEIELRADGVTVAALNQAVQATLGSDAGKALVATYMEGAGLEGSWRLEVRPSPTYYLVREPVD
jgi:hypothetical protein